MFTSNHHHIIDKIMWVKQCHKPSPKSHFYRWYGYHSQSFLWFITLFYPHYIQNHSPINTIYLYIYIYIHIFIQILIDTDHILIIYLQIVVLTTRSLRGYGSPPPPVEAPPQIHSAHRHPARPWRPCKTRCIWTKKMCLHSYYTGYILYIYHTVLY